MTRRLRATLAGVALAGGVAAGAAVSPYLMASADDGDHPATTDGPHLPSDPPTPFVPETGTLDEQIAAAQKAIAEAAVDPGMIVCLTDRGTLAGTIEVDRPADAEPFTKGQKESACAEEWPGSRP